MVRGIKVVLAFATGTGAGCTCSPPKFGARLSILMAGACLLGLAQWLAALPARALDGDQNAVVSANPAPTQEQIRALITRMVANQHADDRAAQEFERVERVVTRKGENTEILTDRTDRVLFSGTGSMKLPIADKGVPVPPDQYRNQLEYAVTALSLAMHPNDQFKESLARFERRRHDHDELVDAAGKAFRVTWAGRETRGGRTLAKFLLEPDPNFRPSTRLAVIFGHLHATLWVDEAQAQMAALQGDISSDVTFAGGIAGKIYRGGHFLMEQQETAPGTWLPTLISYDMDGRKFLFAFGLHERTEVSRYRRIGPPAQAIEVIRNELNNLAADAPTRWLKAS